MIPFRKSFPLVNLYLLEYANSACSIKMGEFSNQFHHYLLELRLQPQARWLSPVHQTGRKVRKSSRAAFCAAELGRNSDGQERKDEARWNRPPPRRDYQNQLLSLRLRRKDGQEKVA